MLILAGVSIATLTGENGIFTRAQEAKNETEDAEEDELRRLTQAEAATYLEKYEYEDSSGEKLVIPAGFAVSQVEGENIIDKGLVIIDSDGNEFVWIDVPKNIYITTNSNYDYDNIEIDLQNYVSEYSNDDYKDVFCSEEIGLTELEYEQLKQKMLSSIYENGGFWIGRYEAGSDIASNINEDVTRNLKIQRNKYPYNYIKRSQAQELANTFYVHDSYESSLLFGIQWNLVCKFIEQNDTSLGNTVEEKKEKINVNSNSWGNYKGSIEYPSTFEILRGKYTESPNELESWKEIQNRFLKENTKAILLTTGASEKNKVLNIYDFAGNVWEYTLDCSSSDASNINTMIIS